MTEFKVLGPLEVRHGGERVPVPAGRARVLLATLLLRANRPVSADALVERLWDGSPPNAARARATLHMVVTRLRQALGPANVVRTATHGYLAEVPPGALDLDAFRELAARGRPAEALALWRGDALSDVRSDALHREDVAPLEEERLVVLERRLDADLAAGRSAELVGELRALVDRHPLRERFRGHLMLALYRSGRQAEALAAYREVRALLADELGVDPGPELVELHARILDRGTPPAAVPRQLPARTPHFVGRDAELGALDDLPGAGGPVVISAIDGAGGIGKTALAVTWAHRVAHRFPDGQLYVNLRGFDPVAEPLHPAEVVRGFLTALGVPPERVPPGADEQAALYRTTLAGRRVLVLLDNARDVDQVRPLLPGSARCLTLVTSRNRLAGLVAREGARPVVLGVLAEPDARRLLAGVVGADRVAREPAAATRLVELCAGLPLALAVVAARAAVDPTRPLAARVEELAGARLPALDDDDPYSDVRAVVSWSYRALSEGAARVFRLASLHPGRTLSAASARSAAGVTEDGVRAALAELVDANLLAEVGPDRYAYHDLVREWAAERAGDEAAAARRRVFDHLLHAAVAAAGLIDPSRGAMPVPPAPPAVGVAPWRPADAAAAWEWLDVECEALIATVRVAVDVGADQVAWQLCWTMAQFFDRRGRWHDWLGVQRLAMTATARLGDDTAHAVTQFNAGHVLARVGAHGEAAEVMGEALAAYRRAGDLVGQGKVNRTMAWVRDLEGRYPEALEHAWAAVECFTAVDDVLGLAGAYNAISVYETQLGDYRSALDHATRAVEAQRAAGHRYGLANALDTLGYAHHHLGDHRRALACFAESVRIFREVGGQSLEAEVLAHRGEAEEALGDVVAARRTWTAALELMDRMGHVKADEVRARLAAAGDTGPRRIPSPGGGDDGGDR
ncbi:AfsR/SARP family transcriptional regulator [Saccharothrix obliqua]|uniref:AfsR/SARP family transcriptional regulator n=1 Tax=Saccharothrix obliqua TaxID=2861747 RepID=UPI001C5F5BF2|nr:BTAD domain-containing putative transcriptional regulator [Saccharothrix obliqua]MBW4716004.1 tetratricopeptide repeat protein [Saccharothrix obliqua]